MGNQLLKNHEINKENYVEGGFQNQWKLHFATKLDEKNQKNNCFTAFIFKKSVLKHKNIPQAMKDEFLTFLKKEPQNLAKFKHPYILNITEPVTEHKKYLIFATEKISTSVGEALKRNKMADLHCGEVEFKLHILEILDALNFLHNNVKIAHCNLSPENIYVTENNQWKLSGFNFSGLNAEIEKKFKENEACLKDFPRLSPDANYASPEIFDSSNKISFACDVFSLGMSLLKILLSLDQKEFKENSSLETQNNEDKQISFFLSPSLEKHKEEVTNFISKLPTKSYFQKLKGNIKFLFTRMLELDPQKRPSVKEIQASAWLNDPLVQALNYLNALLQKDEAQQTSFFKGFQKIIMKFDSKIIKTRILPKMLCFLCKDHCASSVLQTLLLVMDPNLPLSKSEFMEIIWPSLKQLISAKEITAQCLFLLVNNMQKLFEFLGSSETQANFLPLFMKCFDCGVPRLQEAILNNSEFLVKKLDFPSIKNKILPRVLKLCSDEKYDIRKLAISCLSLIYSFCDKTSINEQILPTLEKALKKGGDEQDIVFPILSIYEGVASVIGSEVNIF